MNKKVNRSVGAPAPTTTATENDDLGKEDSQTAVSPNISVSQYRKRALARYKRSLGGVEVNVCVVCGFGIPAVLEVAHLNHDRTTCTMDDLALLCPNCHKMHDIGLIETKVVKMMRDHQPNEDWTIRMKDAGKKSAATRLAKAVKTRKSVAAKKAWETRTKGKAKVAQLAAAGDAATAEGDHAAA
ncbi:MAG: HNH endonuclease [Variovorax sp.]|nr:HNH endonuclease [Variovorax sp.]